MVESADSAVPPDPRRAIDDAIALLARHQLPPTPLNLMLGYAYAGGRFPDLKSRVDQLLGSAPDILHAKWTEVACRHVWSQETCPHVFEGVESLHSAIAEVLASMSDAEGEATTYARFLGQTADRLKTATAIELVRDMLAEVIRMTEATAKKYHDIESVLETTAEQIAVLRLSLEEARREAVTDHLTGLFNRKYLDARLRELVAEAKRAGRELCFLLLDIDGFKAFNDSFGHKRGDDVIRLVGRIIRSAVRDTDVPARFGGDEFAIILPRTAMVDAQALAERIRHALADRKIVIRSSKQDLGKVTASLGLARLEWNQSVEQLFEATDQALYQAKHQGRNRVVTAPPASAAKGNG